MNKSEIFINKALLKHGNKYDYSKVNYINWNTKVIIICKEHGEFLQVPNNHLNNGGCNKCGILNKTESIKNFIKKSSLIHKDDYDYTMVNYINDYNL